MDRLLNRHWHHLDQAEVIQLLETDADRGLSLREARDRLEQGGPNRLPDPARRGRARILLEQFNQPLVYILLVAVAVTAGLGETVDAAVILGVVLSNAVVGFWQESRAEQAMESLRRMVTTRAVVIREGGPRELSSEELVPGDLVMLEAGAKVPADLRLIEARGLQVDESALTGESIHSGKHPGNLPPETILADRRNMAYSGTLVTAGSARGVVVATGPATVAGRINELTESSLPLETPLTRQVASFSRMLLVVILGLAGLTVAIGVSRGQQPLEIFMAAVALAVGAIPEGLPAALTITMAIGVRRMAARRAIVRKLPAVETLGSTTVICADKTGTLTQNQMTVQNLFAGGRLYSVTGSGYDPAGEILDGGRPADPALHPALRELLVASVLCNDSGLERANGGYAPRGDPTEVALVVAAAKAGIEAEAARAQMPRRDVIPFESERQLMASLNQAGEGPVVYLKGAVERVLERCAAAMDEEGSRGPLDAEFLGRVADDQAARGLRVLALARGRAPAGGADFSVESLGAAMEFLGFQCMLDPPRDEARAAVAACRRAGIAVKMITGDHALTATAIARALDLADGAPALTGRELAALPPEELMERAARTAVFARVEPEQKLRLVEALQARGQVVAMTGDGVNDAPALRRADIGIAMGRSGTEVAREASDIILTDDNFASIEAAVEEGRRVFDNLTRFVIWTLPTNLGEGLVLLAAILVGTRLPILPLQILWINMTTAALLGLTLAFEPLEAGAMERPPRKPGQSLLTRELLARIVTVSVILLGCAFGMFQAELAAGAGLEAARTSAVNVFVVVEAFYLFNCRDRRPSLVPRGLGRNLWVPGGAALMLLLQVGFTYLPFMNRLFASAPLPAASWAAIVVAGLGTYIFIELEKSLRRRAPGRPATR